MAKNVLSKKLKAETQCWKIDIKKKLKEYIMAKKDILKKLKVDV